MEIKIRIPFPMPTWNRVLEMHPWERKRLRDWIHRAVFISIRAGTASQTQTGAVINMSSMGLSTQAYFEMIRPRKSCRSASHRKKLANHLKRIQ